jgi:protein-S-isoprenylcysteine O-methyltransferase
MDLDVFLYSLFAIPCALREFYISTKKYSSSSKDRGTLRFIWFIILCSQMLSVHYIRLGYGIKIIENSSFKYFLWIPLNIILYFMGHFLRQQAIEQLGQWFTSNVRTDENQQLIDFGLYSKVRHPSYTGVLMYFLAVIFLLNNWLGVIGIMIPICLVFLYRIHVEEQELKKHFGIKYEQYKLKVPKRIIPKIF